MSDNLPLLLSLRGKSSPSPFTTSCYLRARHSTRPTRRPGRQLPVPLTIPLSHPSTCGARAQPCRTPTCRQDNQMAAASPVATVGTWWSPFLLNMWDPRGLILTSWDDKTRPQRSTFFSWAVRGPPREGSANYFWSCHTAFSKTREEDRFDVPWLGF